MHFFKKDYSGCGENGLERNERKSRETKLFYNNQAWYWTLGVGGDTDGNTLKVDSIGLDGLDTEVTGKWAFKVDSQPDFSHFT